MSPFLLVAAVLFVLMAKRLADMYLGESYVCPSCGARSEGRHSCRRLIFRAREQKATGCHGGEGEDSQAAVSA